MPQNISENILVEVVSALCDDNNRVLVETINGVRNLESFSTSLVQGRDNTGIPFPERGYSEANVALATSIKIGKNISIKKLSDGTFVVRTAKSEAKFNINRDNDFKRVWQSALLKYEHKNASPARYFYPIREYSTSKRLRDATRQAPVAKKDKYLQAQENLKNLGIENEKRITQYMQKKNMENSGK